LIADDSPTRRSTLRPSYVPDVLIVRLEHVGLPLAAEAVRGGLTVVGYDVDEAVVNDLNPGRPHTALVSGMAIRCHELDDIPWHGSECYAL
jgi:UDP-N-acetyl-D-mannosaminuronate dehydrogenase